MAGFFDMPPIEKLRFLHIPKNAGTSFANCLRRLYGASRLKGNILVFGGDLQADLAHYQSLPSAARERIVLVSGHAPLVTGEPEIDGLPTITMLRHPVRRVISYLNYLNSGETPYVKPGQLKVDELLEQHYPSIQNMQLRTLLGQSSYEFPDSDQASFVNRGLEVLETRLGGFGITEEFDDSLLLLRHMLGWRKYPVYTWLNRERRGYPIKLTDRQLDRIQEQNALDIEFYSAARTLFAERVALAADHLVKSRRIFGWCQKLHAPALSGYLLYHRARSAFFRQRWHGGSPL